MAVVLVSARAFRIKSFMASAVRSAAYRATHADRASPSIHRAGARHSGRTADSYVLAWTRDERLTQYALAIDVRSEEHTSELQSLMRISYAVFYLKKKINTQRTQDNNHTE